MNDNIIRSVYRIRSKLLCLCGRHLWATRRNPEVGGREAVFKACYRCGKEQQKWGLPTAGSPD